MTALDQYLVPARRKPKRLWFLAAVGILIAVSAVREYLETDGRVVQLKQEAARLHVPLPATPRLSKVEAERGEYWKALATERAFDWYPVFKALERADSPDIELLEFRPDKANGQLTLRGEAKSMGALVDYLERVSGQQIVGRAYLAHQKTSVRGSLRTISFEIKSSLRRSH